jgi:hypothetical protein
MHRSELNSQMFDTILKTAVSENFKLEMDAMPPEGTLSKEFAPSLDLRRKIQRIVIKEYHNAVLYKVSQIAKKAAVIIAIIIPISFGSLLSVEASRNVIFNSVLEWKADHVDIYFQQESSSKPSQDTDESGLYQPQYIPDGFSEFKTLKFGATQRITYQNEGKESIIFDQTPLSKGKIGVDTEHTTYEEITINGQKASLFAAKTPNDKTYILWQIGKISFELSSSISQQELVKMAENIKFEKK